MHDFTVEGSGEKAYSAYMYGEIYSTNLLRPLEICALVSVKIPQLPKLEGILELSANGVMLWHQKRCVLVRTHL